jgi:hypothetical protein
VTLDFSGNRLSGSLPSFSDMKNLRSLIIAGNNFTGDIPSKFPRRLTNFYAGMRSCWNGFLSCLGYNRLSGTIPSSFTDHIWDSIIVNNNLLSGTIPPNIYVGGIFSATDNKLSGMLF